LSPQIKLVCVLPYVLQGGSDFFCNGTWEGTGVCSKLLHIILEVASNKFYNFLIILNVMMNKYILIIVVVQNNKLSSCLDQSFK